MIESYSTAFAASLHFQGIDASIPPLAEGLGRSIIGRMEVHTDLQALRRQLEEIDRQYLHQALAAIRPLVAELRILGGDPRALPALT